MLDVNPNAYWENHIDMLVGLTLPMQRFAGLLLADVQSAADAHWQLARAAASTQAASALTRTALAIAGQLAR